MNKTHLAFITAVATILVVVQPGSAQEKERCLALRTADGKYITANTGNTLDLTGTKIGSKQTFRLIDINGGEVADKDEVRIRYTPNTNGQPDPSKSSYWKEVAEGVKRTREGDVFKVRLVETKYVFQAPSGKFVAGPVAGGLLAVTNAQEGALLVEPVDVVPKTPKQATTEKPATE